MTRLFLAAGVAALAIAAPASAERGGGNKGGDRAAKVERGGGGQRAQMKADRRGGDRVRVAQAERRGGNDRKAVRAERRNDDRKVVRAERRGRDDAKVVKADRREFREQRVADRVDRRAERIDRRDDRIAARINRRDDVVRVRDLDDDFFVAGRGHPIVDGCPPGRATNPLCMPPGQYQKMMRGQALPVAYRDSLLPLGLRDIYRDTDDYYWRFGDGYAYRVDRDTNLIAALLPLIGGGLGVGQLFPTTYMNSYVPDYYRAFYPDSGDDYYRYANGYVYEIDRDNGLIEDVIPLYASGYGMGQMLPASYSYYNVPSQYRSLYYDTDDYYYRYAPGAIYQVDRDTSLITAVASLLAGDLTVGQPLPMAYSAYNVPLAYRSQYYDTPSTWYRYNDGYIYQVDPTTRLITAVIDAIV